MSCPLNRNRFKGSGFEKRDDTTASNELSQRLTEMLSIRNEQNADVWRPREHTDTSTERHCHEKTRK